MSTEMAVEGHELEDGTQTLTCVQERIWQPDEIRSCQSLCS